MDRSRTEAGRMGRRLAIMAIIAGLAVFLGGCGGDSSSTSGTAQAPPAPAAQPPQVDAAPAAKASEQGSGGDPTTEYATEESYGEDEYAEEAYSMEEPAAYGGPAMGDPRSMGPTNMAGAGNDPRMQGGQPANMGGYPTEDGGYGEPGVTPEMAGPGGYAQGYPGSSGPGGYAEGYPGSSGPGYGTEMESGMDEYANYGSQYGQSGYGNPGYGPSGANVGASGGNAKEPDLQFAANFIAQNCLGCHNQRQARGEVRLDALVADITSPLHAELVTKVEEVLEEGKMPPPPRQVNAAAKEGVLVAIRKAREEGVLIKLEDLDLLTRAKIAFEQGKEREAIEFARAHAVTADGEAAGEVLDKVKWFPLGKRPEIALRFAVGVNLDAPSGLTDIKPIGSPQFGNGSGGFAGGSEYGGGRGGYGAAGTEQSEPENRSLQALTGEFGEEFLQAYQTRWTGGQLSELFADVDISKTTNSSSTTLGSSPGAPGYAGGPEGYGGPAMAGGEEYGGGYGPGAYGGGNYGGEGVGGSNQDSQATRPILPGNRAAPGLIFIGIGSQNDLLEKVRELGLDGLFIFDVEASANRRTRIVTNETRLRFVLPSGDAVAATSRLTNTEVERNRLRGKDEDIVEKSLERLFVKFDEEVALQPLPPFKPEHAEGRIRALLAQREQLPEDEEPKMNLTLLFETRLFQHLGLFTEEQAAIIYQIILEGNEGEVFVKGTADDRMLVIDPFLPSI
ncbi:MAG: hypothetical protein KatS3mg111_0101 [Pirellulaceae bacterium]|nr:MAG: hypothetical protein KatS3mg111_0101 [Pirellulaceae bacterium]